MKLHTSAALLCSVLALLVEAQVGLKDRDLAITRIEKPEKLKELVVLPRGYAIVIGISEYKNLAKSATLPFAEKDAQNVYSALISQEGGNIEYQNIKRLIGRDATVANIRDALENWLPKVAQPADRVVVFFVGHGVVGPDGRGYLAPYDIDPKQLETTGYPMDKLGKVLSQDVKAKWKVLLTDACHSGKISIDTSSQKVNDSLRGLPQGFLSFSSSRASQQSFEDQDLSGGSGVFSYFLVRGWLGAADQSPTDGKVTAEELVAYVQTEVREYARLRNEKQSPLESGDFPDDLILGFSAKRRQDLVARTAEPQTGTIVVEVNLQDVEVTVDDLRIGVASPEKPLTIPGLASGKHNVRGARIGYDPAVTEVNVVPGGMQTISIRLLHQRTVKPTAKAAYDQAESLWTRSRANPADLQKAADGYAKALSQDDTFSKAALGLAYVKQSQGRTDEAMKACKKALQIDSDYVEARELYGVLLMENGDYLQAARELQRAQQADPKSSYAHSVLAEALLWADRPLEAEAASARAITLDGSSAQGFLLRAEARRAQEKFPEAILDYHESVRLQEFGSGALRTAAYWAIGTGIKKHRSGRRALYRNQLAAAYFGLCAAENGMESYQQAIRHCSKAISLDKEDSDSYVLMAESYAQLFSIDNRKDYLVKTKDNIEVALRLNPNMDKAEDLRRKLIEVGKILNQMR